MTDISPESKGADMAAPEKRTVPKWALAIGAIVALVIIAVLVIMIIPVPLEGNVSPDSRSGQVYSALAGNGITDAAVDFGTGGVLVSASVPDAVYAPAVKYIVYGAVSQVSDPPPQITVEVFGPDYGLLETSTIQTQAVLDYADGKITIGELENSIGTG